MTVTVVHIIRQALHAAPDGLTLEDLSVLLKRPRNNLRKVLKTMPDTYIDRWETAPRGQYKAVWCACIPPIDCPTPVGWREPHD